MFDCPYTVAETPESVAEAVRAAMATPGLSIIEAPTHRAETAAQMRAYVARLSSALTEAMA
ncbi:hypothetical protein D3C78_1958460 [compost metagenome]